MNEPVSSHTISPEEFNARLANYNLGFRHGEQAGRRLWVIAAVMWLWKLTVVFTIVFGCVVATVAVLELVVASPAPWNAENGDVPAFSVEPDGVGVSVARINNVVFNSGAFTCNGKECDRICIHPEGMCADVVFYNGNHEWIMACDTRVDGGPWTCVTSEFCEDCGR